MKLSEALNGLYQSYGELQYALHSSKEHTDETYIDLKDSEDDLKEAIDLVISVLLRHKLQTETKVS